MPKLKALANEVDTVDELDELFIRTMLDSRELPKHTFNGSTVPMVAIPTTLSGGEYNAYGACTNDTTHRKQLFNNETQEPRFIVLDAALTSTTPIRVWISTVVRAIDHCIEALCSIEGNDDANVDFMESLRLLASGLLQCTKAATNSEARQKCQPGRMNYMKVMLLRIPLGQATGSAVNLVLTMSRTANQAAYSCQQWQSIMLR